MDSISSAYMPTSYQYAARVEGGKTIVPMSGQALYSNFSNMTGVAAQKGAPAYSVDMLNVLDLVMSQLERSKSAPETTAETPKNLSPSGVGDLIQQYGAKLHDLATAPASPYTNPASFGEPGSLFSLAA
jgi:hypothetical protein